LFFQVEARFGRMAQISAAHRREFILLVRDGTSSHTSKDLIVPENLRLVSLPPYSPELNPQTGLARTA
jgi:transposase